MKLNTVCGPLTLISLEKFLLNCVSTQDIIPGPDYGVDHFILDNIIYYYGSKLDMVEPKMERAILRPCLDHLLECLTEDFLECLETTEYPCPKNIRWEMEDRVVDSIEEFGIPNYLVNVGERMWAIVSVQDFLIYRTPDKTRCKLVCLNKKRNFIAKYKRADDE